MMKIEVPSRYIRIITTADVGAVHDAHYHLRISIAVGGHTQYESLVVLVYFSIFFSFVRRQLTYKRG